MNQYINLKAIYMIVFMAACLISNHSQANAEPAFDQALLSIQQEWAHVNYQLKGNDQEKAFTQLLTQSVALVEANHLRAEAWIWQGIVQSSYAGAVGGLSALSFAKAAKASLEKALSLDDKALDGSGYTSLGILYHKVPGWPIGFGDDDLAKTYLEKALALNPTGIDPNYFYGEFLFNEKHYQAAHDHLLLAQKAPSRMNRALADKERQQEVSVLLAKVEKKLTKKK